MIHISRREDPIAAIDTTELFEEYLETCCGEAEMAQWVMRHLDEANVGLTESVQAMLAEALSYLGKRELIEQVVLNEHDRRAYPDYRRWCLEALEGERARAIREGVAR